MSACQFGPIAPAFCERRHSLSEMMSRILGFGPISLQDERTFMPYRPPAAVCPTCLISFSLTPGKGRRRRYCSAACRAAAYRRRKRAQSAQPAPGDYEYWRRRVWHESRIVAALLAQIPEYRPLAASEDQIPWVRTVIEWGAIEWLALWLICDAGPMTSIELRSIRRLQAKLSNARPLPKALARVGQPVLRVVPYLEGAELENLLKGGLQAGLIVTVTDPLQNDRNVWSATERGLAIFGYAPRK